MPQRKLFEKQLFFFRTIKGQGSLTITCILFYLFIFAQLLKWRLHSVKWLPLPHSHSTKTTWNGEEPTWLTRWREPSWGWFTPPPTPLLESPLPFPLLSSPLHLLSLRLLPPIGLLYLRLNSSMWKKPSSGPVDLEIEYSSRSGGDKPCSERTHPARGTGSNEFQRQRARGLCRLFSRHSLMDLWCSAANTTFPTEGGLFGLPGPFITENTVLKTPRSVGF